MRQTLLMGLKTSHFFVIGGVLLAQLTLYAIVVQLPAQNQDPVQTKSSKYFRLSSISRVVLSHSSD
jgi:hypothetical protein